MTCYYPSDKSRLYRDALKGIGYDSRRATASKVREAFMDQVDAGVFRDLDAEEVEYREEEGTLTVDKMAKALYKMGHDC